MIFLRRDRSPVRRLVAVRVGLFFLGAGIWLAGVMTENDRVTAVAIVVVGIAILMGAYLRRRRMSEMEDEGEVGEG
jgi:uncharacterized membrane protein YidH (DUF202 family)